MLINGEKANINDIEKDKSFNINDNDRRIKLCSDIEAESGAERYIKKLNAPGCREFFIKVMYYLPYDIREGLLESALRPHIKVKSHYFTFCAKKELLKRGIV